ncbi:uncharacterized protein LOC121382279 [Gigantopelta aegis]|uniref:uncharacterized protein LOC121382279 n=1 Tax=Gigantopelta aegis TaxID=1735272 RepID=UPI001B88E044|nr:uncharacterized protein LOC121382279 [Gigantopelta aegis]
MAGDEENRKFDKPILPNGNKLNSMFCVQDEDGVFPEIPTIKSRQVSTRKRKVIITGSNRQVTKTPKESLVTAFEEFTTDTAKVMMFLKKKVRGRKREKETEVKEIHITPIEDESKWGHRPVNSATSRTSTGTAYSSGSTRSKEDGIEVVHDMANDDPSLR